MLKAAAPAERVIRLRLQSDVYWNKMTKEEQDFTAKQTLTIAEQSVSLFRSLHANDSMQDLIEQYGLKFSVSTDDTVESLQKSPIINRRTKRIKVYPHDVEEAMALLSHIGITVTQAEVLRMMFFRGFCPFFVESHDIVPSLQLPPVRVRQLGFLTSSEAVKSADDACADYFTTVLSVFPIPVGLIPFLYWIQSGKSTADQLLLLLKS